MMQEILKPLLENDVLNDEVKEAVEKSLTEALQQREDAVRDEVEKKAKQNFEAAKTKFEETYKTLEESYKTKLEEAKSVADEANGEIEDLQTKIDDLESKPFVNVSESDLEEAEAKLTEELEEKYEKAFELAKEKYEEAFDVIVEANSDAFESYDTTLSEVQNSKETLEEQVKELETSLQEAEEANDVETAVTEKEQEMMKESQEKIETLKENLVSSTEIFLEQELAEMKKDYQEMMKEKQGRELLESIKGLVKQYWDVDSEVAQEVLEMKKEAESKVTQYKDMLKKEHNRLEESQNEIDGLKKKLLVESKGSILSDDKKARLEKMTENIDSSKLETEIDSLMESVVDTFNEGFSKEEISNKVEKTSKSSEEESENDLFESKSAFGSGDVESKNTDDSTDELNELMDYAGVRK